MLEAYCRNKFNAATGMIMWLLNSAHPSHMWNLFDFYGRASGSVHGPMRATQHYRNEAAVQARGCCYCSDSGLPFPEMCVCGH